MIDIDTSFDSFSKILNEIGDYFKTIFSEEDTRVKIIDRILFEVLGYSYKDIVTEPPAGGGYIDYKVSFNDVGKLIIEAKRDGLDFNISKDYSGRAFKLNGPVFKDATIQDGLRQAIYYCAIKGIELACLTNGRTWIIFRANRLGDGKDIFEGKGFVFSDLDSVKKEFKLFYELLSPSNVNSLKFRALIQEAEGIQIRTKDDSKFLRTENHLQLLKRSNHSYDFDRVMNEFFSKLSGDQDPNLLINCFVETRESKAAEAQLIRISEDILHKIRPVETEEGSLLQELIERIKTTNRHEFVLLVGGKGAGKSTFIERFFKITLPEELKESTLLIRVNLADSDGNVKNIIDWLNTYLLEECEHVVYQGQPSYEEIVGMFFNEYKRLSEGGWRTLYEKDKDQFKIDFGRHVEERRANRPHEYIKRLIGDITKSRKKVPCIVFDNTDHFGIEFQEKVFQYARSIYNQEICLIIVPITDKTSWELSKQGAIQSFENETMFLPTPPPRRIIEKRINYLEEKLDISTKTRVNYFLSRGIKLNINGIQNFVKCLQGIFLKDQKVAKWIGNLSNFDIRRCLDLTRDIIASPSISIDELLIAYSANPNEEIPIDLFNIKNAIIKKLYSSYPVGHHSFVQNLFFPTANLNCSPILSIRILQLLLDRKNQRGQQDNYILVNEVLDYFGNMSVARSTTISHLDWLVKKGLVYGYDPTILDINTISKIEISPSGHEHYLWGFYDEQYLLLMCEVSPICNNELFEFLREHYYDKEHVYQVMYNYLSYLQDEDEIYCSIPDHISYKGQVSITNRIKWRKQMLNREMRRPKNFFRRR